MYEFNQALMTICTEGRYEYFSKLIHDLMLVLISYVNNIFIFIM